MPSWISLPAEPLIYQPDQQQFLEARRLRHCKTCKDSDGNPFQFRVVPPVVTCPRCTVAGHRLFDFLTIIAGRRYGKSRIGSIAAVEEACVPNTIGWACAPTVPKLHRYIIPAFQQLIPTEWVKSWNTEFLDLRLKNGSLIHFQTLEDPDQGRGQGLDWLWIDEICELSKKHWEVISPSLDDRLGVAFFTTSPRGYDWVYEEFFVPAEQDTPGFWALHAKTSDNPKFQTPEARARLDAKRLQMSDLMYRQEYEADFVTFEGAIYGDSFFDHHILRTQDAIRAFIPEWPDINPTRPTIIGLDTGADHPFGALRLVITEKGIVAVSEYLERNRSFMTHANELRMMAAGSAPIWAINKNEKQASIELDQHGITPQKAENDQKAGIERVKTWLQNNQLFFVAERVPLTIKQLKGYRWNKNTGPDDQKHKEKVFKKNDELTDCLRYALILWPALPVPPVPSTKRDLSHLSESDRHSIERLRRCEDNTPKEPETVTGDFWTGSETSDIFSST